MIASPRRVELAPVDLLVLFIVVASAGMLAQLVAGVFIPAQALFASFMICAAAGWMFPRRPGSRFDARTAIAAGLLLALALALRWHPFLYVEGGQDQGVYVAMSSHFERTRGARVTDEVRLKLPESERAEYDRLNNRYDGPAAAAPGRSEGEHQPGVFIEDLARSAYVFQFYPLHPLWMSAAARILGGENRVYSLVFFSLLDILMLSLLAYELSGRRRLAGFLVAAFLAVNPLHVFLSRFPVTENLVFFFSASAFYYLLRYFNAAKEGSPHPWMLALSCGSWACLFFSHIGGFLYLPLIFTAMVLGIVTVDASRRALHLAAYGAGVLAAYLLSVWYGIAWSFPYSLGTYRILFGSAGDLVTYHWIWIGLLLAVAMCALGAVAWRFRHALRSGWARWRVDRILAMGLLALILVIGARASLEAYELGFTDAYAPRPTATDTDAPPSHSFAKAGKNRAIVLNRLANSGFSGFTHTSYFTLVIYLSPFIFVFVLAMLATRWRGIAIPELLLVLLLAEFVVLRTGIERHVPYYYYGRYLGAELVPYFFLLAAVWLCPLAERPGRARWIAGGIAGMALAWEAAALAPQYPGGEMHRFDASLRPLVDNVGRHDLLIVAGGDYPPLRTALDYYYGKHTMAVDPQRLEQALRVNAGLWPTIHVLSDRDDLGSLSYVGPITLVRDAYAKGGMLDVLPMSAPAGQLRYHHYRVGTSAPGGTITAQGGGASLAIGGVVDFGRNGDSQRYLGQGWSVQEEATRWTDGPSASLVLPLAGAPGPRKLSFETRTFQCVPVAVQVNGQVRERWTFADCDAYTERTVPLTEEDVASGKVTVTFDIPDAKSPYEVNPAIPDRRKLGLSVRRMTVASP